MDKNAENHAGLLLVFVMGNRRLIFSVTAIFLAGALGILLLASPVYNISGTILITSKKLDIPPEAVLTDPDASRAIPPSREDLLTEIHLITSESNIRQAIGNLIEKDIPLAQKDSFLARLKEGIKSSIAPAVRFFRELFHGKNIEKIDTFQDVMTKKMREKLSAEIVPGANVIIVSLKYGNPDTGQIILDAVLNNYLKFRINKYSHPSGAVFFRNKKEIYEKELARLHKDKIKLLQTNGVNDPEKELAIQMNRIARMTEHADTLREDIKNETEQLHTLRQAYAKYMGMAERIYYPFPYSFEDREISRYNESYNNLLLESIELVRVYKKESQKVSEMEKQLKNIWQKLMFLIENKIEARNANLDYLHRSLATAQTDLVLLRKENEILIGLHSEISQIDHNIELIRHNYDTIFHKKEASEIRQASIAAQLSNVQILQEATAKPGPLFPKTGAVIPISILAGLITGLCVSFIKEFFDHTFRVPEHVYEHLDLPVIGSIPFLPES